jgi:ribulose-bisphosphate carboxylase large chain
MSDEVIEVVYRVRCAADELAARSEALLLEQTVELPRTALHTAFVRDRIVGRIVGTEAVEGDRFLVTLAQPLAATAGDPAQFLNVLFGNSSLQPDIELDDVRVPESLARAFGGPRFGIAGLRRLTHVQGRALTASALKPMGLSATEMAALCRTFALAGIDVVKDDHGLADHVFCPFVERVRACLGATLEAAQTTGRRTLYVPNLIGSPLTVLRQAQQAQDLGAEAVMVSPMLLGLPLLLDLTRRGLPLLAHPAMGGSQRISPRALLGKLFPLFGADAVIYPNVGGRFSYSAETCAEIAAALRARKSAGAPALPVPAGGIKTETVSTVLEFYGADAMLLIGGGLLESSDAKILLARSQSFVEAVQNFSYRP